MGKTYKEKLNEVSAFVFDFDGVVTTGRIAFSPSGERIVEFFAKDVYALERAVAEGFPVAVVARDVPQAVDDFLGSLRVELILENKGKHPDILASFIRDHNLSPDRILYMGDDIPDIELMTAFGMSACPSNAAEEVKSISDYVSLERGGAGAIRDVIEQTLKVRNRWWRAEEFDASP